MTSGRKILIAVCGTTGVGKSALAIKLAQMLSKASKSSAACLNGDSLQVYKGLDIVTNKPSKLERMSCEHYLFDFIEPTEEYSVAQFKQDAENCIQNLHENNSVPIVVGGTNYYIQTLLWDKMMIADQTSEQVGLSHKGKISDSCHESIKDQSLRDSLCFLLEGTDPRYHSAVDIEAFCKQHSLHDALCLVDPIMSKRWHPKDYRKIRRSLEIYYTTGLTQSEWYKSQQEQGGQILRYPTILIWLYGKPDILDPRLDYRVDLMMRNGLLDEIHDMRGKVLKNQVIGADSNYTRGVLQAIGFKEFDEYFNLKESLEPQSKQDIDKALKQGVEKMKLATRQYARQQVHWIKNKLGPAIIEEHKKETGAFYVIDATDPKAVTEDIVQKAVDLVYKFQNGLENEEWSVMAPNLKSLMEMKEKESNWDLFECDYCIDRESGQKRIFTGQKLWELHQSSRNHKKQVAYATGVKRPEPGDREGWIKYAKLKSQHQAVDSLIQ